MNEPLPRLTITMGDPAGIGPEVTVKALADPSVRGLADWIVVGESVVLEPMAAAAGFGFDRVIGVEDEIPSAGLPLLDCRTDFRDDFCMGRLSIPCGKAALEFVDRATGLCLDGKAQGIVTAPLNKEAVVRGGEESFCGHTEHIARLCGVMQPRMLLVNDQLCVVHVSTHCSLANATRLDVGRIVKTVQLGHEALGRLGFTNPRVAVCGLNPHAGENGMFGSEESEFIVPAIEEARAAGIDCQGPFPADTLFMQAVRGAYDLVVAMYHDQGHVPMKLLDFEHTVNVTLGLPIIRTSVDHGTAFDIAGQDLADPEDMKAAMRLAVELARQKTPGQPVK
ncbi:MAG: 4-hydroxythreonine-4-phosphate dehydrogenase PdxA [Planctomycetota bacterium]|nr:4-hydroxythreonine-4-phosphate dehydrogenase PdxA [Planctomycetota bacterium]